MKILVACEESQAVTKEFRKLGHEAFSNDITDCSGEFPEWHIKGDCLEIIRSQKWDMVIAFPPCTYLTVTGNRWFNVDKYGDKAIKRHKLRKEACEFFLSIYDCGVPRVAIENPVGVMSSLFRKPDQIIQPYHFGDAFEKKTCLWLKGLPKLQHTNIVEPPQRTKYKSGKTMATWYADLVKLPAEQRSKTRSKTFKGIAEAMAKQWG